MRLGTYYRALLLDKLEIRASKRLVLEVGGYDGFWLSQQQSVMKVCLDLNPQPKHGNINYIRADALALPLKSNCFQQVFAFDVMEHVSDERRFIQELWRVAGPDSQVIISVPNKNLRMFPPFMTTWASRRWGHHKNTGYSREELMSIMPPDARIELTSISELCIRLFYFPLRLLWVVSPRTTRLLVRAILWPDKFFMKGEHGRFVAILSK